MESKIKNERTYYILESPKGIYSEKMSVRELSHCVEEGYFTIFLVLGDTGQIYQARRFKIARIYKYTEKTIVTEEELDTDTASGELEMYEKSWLEDMEEKR